MMMIEPNTILQERYQVTRLIGQGGMGAVYEAVDQRLGTPVALKQTLAPGGQLGRAFEREARLLAMLRHPSLPKVIDHFADASGQYLVMEFIPGPDLAALLEDRGAPFGVREVLDWADQLLQVLEYLHTRQPPILHRDIKPQNLKISGEGVAVLLDFGLARGDPSVQSQGSVTGSVFGYTAHYAPLEQIHNSGTDVRSDLYALAATLHHLLTGATPVDAISRATAVLRRQPDPLHPPTALNPRVPPAVSRVLMQALALNQDERPADAATMRAALAQAARELEAPSAPALLPDEQLRSSPGLLRTYARTAAGVVRGFPARLVAWRAWLAGVRLPAAVAPVAERRWAAPAAAALALMLVLLALLFAGTIGREAPAATPVPIAEATPQASAAPVDGAPTATPDAAFAVPPRATPPASLPPAAGASSLDPAEVFAGSLPITITVHGERLDTVGEFRFVAPGGATITPQVQHSSPAEARLLIAELPVLQGGEQAFTLYLDSTAQPVAVVLRGYRALKEMRGVRAEFAYTGRVLHDESGAFTQMLSQPDTTSEPVVVLRGGDQVEVLRDDVAGWYQVRLWIEVQGTRTGLVGWVERWLVDGEGAPESVVFVGQLGETPTDAAVRCGQQYQSSVFGGVKGPNGADIRGALVRVSSADGANRYTERTRDGGVFEIGGLGCTTWVVELIEVPGVPSFTANAVRVRLNGGLYTSAEVRFRQQP